MMRERVRSRPRGWVQMVRERTERMMCGMRRWSGRISSGGLGIGLGDGEGDVKVEVGGYLVNARWGGCVDGRGLGWG